MFGLLNNVVWTSAGPCAVDGFEQARLALRAAGHAVQVFGLDKFPRMTDYVVPSGVRIADADRVRLGAHLADGTTVMHEGYVNFNAGTLGTSMVEGRISQGVVVDEGSDIGGGASIMGTLSGGGKEIIRVGRALPARRQRRHRHLARRRLRRRGRALRHRRHPGHAARRHRDQGGRAQRRATACCSAATARSGAVEVLPRPGGIGRAEHRAARQRLRRRRPSGPASPRDSPAGGDGRCDSVVSRVGPSVARRARPAAGSAGPAASTGGGVRPRRAGGSRRAGGGATRGICAGGTSAGVARSATPRPRCGGRRGRGRRSAGACSTGGRRPSDDQAPGLAGAGPDAGSAGGHTPSTGRSAAGGRPVRRRGGGPPA